MSAEGKIQTPYKGEAQDQEYRRTESFNRKSKSARSFLSILILFRIHELDAQFADLQFHAQQFPQSSRDPKLLDKSYIKRTYESAVNIICASCGCCYHEITESDNVPPSYEPLRHLSIAENVNVPGDFSCGIEIRPDRNRIYITVTSSVVKKTLSLFLYLPITTLSFLQ